MSLEQEDSISAISSRPSQDVAENHRGAAWSDDETSRARIFAAHELSENLASSDFDPHLPLLELHSANSKRESTSTDGQGSKYTQKTPPSSIWLPITLRWPFLASLFIISLTLGTGTIALSIYSSRNYGVCDKKDSTAFLFVWRFVPTLIAVVYALLVTVLTNDVKRTEAFARLSKPQGSTAASSLLLSESPWWRDPFEALSKKRSDGWRSWTLFWISIANVMAILLVSPLSAGVLSLDKVQILRDADFNRLDPFQRGPLELQKTATDETYFRTISSVVQNLTTSTWLYDTYTILPFWPVDLGSAPYGASLAGVPQLWTGQTSIFQTNLQCAPMKLTSSDNSDSVVMKFESDDGCKVDINITFLTDNRPPSGGWWSSTAAPNYPTVANSLPPNIVSNSTSQCESQEMFFIASPFYSPNQSLAQLCSSYYYTASNVTAFVESTATASRVSFDEENFNRSRIALNVSLIDLHSFEALFLNPNWSAYYQPPGGFEEIRPVLGGPLALLAATFGNSGFDIDEMFEGIGLVEHAQRVKQRFFGEALQASFVSTGTNSIERIPGQITTTQTRLIADVGIGIALGIILFLTAVMTALVYYCSRLKRRPLNLTQDPGSAAAVMKMISDDLKIRDYFRGFDKIPEDSMKTILGDIHFTMVAGRLVVVDNGKVKDLHKTNIELQPPRSRLQGFLQSLGLSEPNRLDDDWRPAILHRWTGLSLLAFLACLAAALIALFVISKSSGLHQSALLFQSTLTWDSQSVVGLAPYSIIPTVFAVAVKLWWGALEEAFKRLQPYVVMARRPTKVSHGIALSYINSPMFWASGRAFRKGHLLLALVCLGAFWTEVFTVGMSALWQREMKSLSESWQISTQLEIRDIPQVYLVPTNAEPSNTYLLPVLTQLLENPFTSWLYGAVIQLSYNASQPPWSHEGWSFAPVNLSSISTSQTTQYAELNLSTALGAFRIKDSGANIGGPGNVTVRTPAVRGRIECSPYETLHNKSNWLQELNLRNASYWNISVNPSTPTQGYELLTQINITRDSLQEMSTTTFADPSRLVCCANETDGLLGPASIGYWSTNSHGSTYGGELAGEPSTNFTIKWIVGEALEQQFVDVENMTHFVWEKEPSMAALNCQPVIEIASATVTVDLTSLAVLDYSILDVPKDATNAWTDNYEGHNSTDADENPFSTESNVTVSYGYLFMDTLYNAADCARLGEGALQETGYGDEDLTDKTFNFRLKGLNVDYMSYAMFSLAQQNPSALLDLSTLQNISSLVFSTFFQHYASSNVTFTNGGGAFQPIGAKLPFGLPPILDAGGDSSYQDTNAPSYTNRSTEAIVKFPDEQLVMSPTAVVLCLAILAFLACTTLLVYIPYATYFKALPRDVETLASVLALVYDSPRLMDWIRANEYVLEDKHSRAWSWGSLIPSFTPRTWSGNYRATGTNMSDRDPSELNDVSTGLGFFRGEHDISRWGIELEPVMHKNNPMHPYTALAADEAK